MASIKFDPGLVKRVEKAAVAAIDETTQAAAAAARGTSMNLPAHKVAGHRWFGVTPRVERAVISEPARREGGRIVGRFGASARRGDYAFWLERKHPYLRPAADREYRKLAGRIRDRLA